jgi:hypothetical protein
MTHSYTYPSVIIYMSYPVRVILKLWRGRVALFFPIWTLLTIAAELCGVWFVRRGVPSIGRESDDNCPRKKPQAIARDMVPTLILLLGFLGYYMALIVKWEDFAYYDNSSFTLFTLRGWNWPIQIWPTAGRFFPLGQQEFNILRHFTKTAVGYHSLAMAELVAFSGLLLKTDEDINFLANAVLVMIILIVPSVFISFGGLIYEERNILLCLVALVALVRRFEQTEQIAYAAGALGCVQIMLYYKETVFLLISGFAAGRVLLRRLSAGRPSSWSSEQLRSKQSRLDLCFIALCLLFLVYYVAAMFPHWTMQYATGRRLPLLESAVAYLKEDVLAWLLAALVFVRIHRICSHRVNPDPLWDGLAIGAVACLFGYLCLSMYAAYYLAPVDIIAVLYIGRFVILRWGQFAPQLKAVVALTLIAIALQDLSLSAFRAFERKNVIHAKAEMAEVIKKHVPTGPRETQRLFFPFSTPYTVMEYGAYLSYRGVAIDGVVDKPSGPAKIELVSRNTSKSGRCVDYRAIVCNTGMEPDRGDLVILLPDDDASPRQVDAYRDGGDAIFSYEPHPILPRWLFPLVNDLSIVSPIASRKDLTDTWLHASVIVWR